MSATKFGKFAGLLCTVLVGMSVALCAQAQPPSDPGAVTRLQGLLEQTTTMTAAVEQLQMDQDGRELQENRAELTMQKPASFRWAITEPYEELMVTDGKLIWRYEPDLEQVTIQPFDNDFERTPVMLLNGDAASIAESFAVTAVSIPDSDRNRFILVPRKPGSLFERLSLTFAGPVLEEMQFEDSLGQMTSLTFSNVVRNRKLDAEQFRFTPPAGADIIDNTGE